jgi:hypothetical protein
MVLPNFFEILKTQCHSVGNFRVALEKFGVAALHADVMKICGAMENKYFLGA